MIPHDKLICMNDFAKAAGYVVDLAYARADNDLFGEVIYRADAKLWLHEDLAKVVKRAAEICMAKYSKRFVLYDGLRTVDAQEKMLQTKRVAENPEWLREPRMLSVPGAGGHPRGMAIDIGLMDLDGALCDMGSAFDDMSAASHRGYDGLSAAQVEHRRILDECMLDAAVEQGVEIVLLSQEWWDFRLTADVVNAFAALRDEDVLPEMRMC